ncbi:protein cordon-bleu [Pholidichthys leucotaenia]
MMTDSCKPPSGRRMKAPAPPPPPHAPQPAPRRIFRNTTPDGGGPSGMDAKENILRPTVDLEVTLPQGHTLFISEDGRKALMDLLVELCSRYHLNPALHTLEILSPEGQPLRYKPNALLGSLNVACVFIKEKVLEDRAVRRPAPKVPEKTVRLMVNYHISQKAVVRVNPLVPLQTLIPVICDKCEFDPAHVLLLKDNTSRQELPLDKSLTELGIKELYAHDRSLESIRSSTTSLGRPEKKGILGIFPFSRRKSKTETASVDMDDCDDKLIQNTDTQSNGFPTVSGFHSVENRPGTLAQSQSLMNITRTSPKGETKKKRAPAPPGAPTPRMDHSSFESYQMGLGSESQQRKRKAPAPPPTPTSITHSSDDASVSVAPTPDSQASEKPTPALRTKVVQSTTVCATTVIIQTGKTAPNKTAAQPPPVYDATPTASSPTPSSSTTDSMAVQDSSSELSHSLDDSDADLDQVESHCSSLTTSTVSGSVRVQPTAKGSSGRMEGSVSCKSAKVKQEATSNSSSRSETESALNLKLDEAENKRHSGMAGFSSTSSSAASGHQPETEAPEAETVSLGSSSSGSSLLDQGYAASEGMAEGEDSGMISSPSDTQPTSPNGSLSLDGSSGDRGEKLSGPLRDNSSDSDEGCATWGSMHRHNDISSHVSESVGLKNNYEEDSELTAQLHKTLADLEADLADHTEIVSAEGIPYQHLITDSNEVPVSVVDMDVPVTAIDEVLEDYEHIVLEQETKSLTRTETYADKDPGFCNKSSMEPQNKNNNAYTAAVSNKTSRASIEALPQSEQADKPEQNKPIRNNKEEKIVEEKVKKIAIVSNNGMKENKQALGVNTDANVQKNKSTEIQPDSAKTCTEPFQQKKPNILPTNHKSGEEKQRADQTSQGKFTCNVTSRFGMKTFTVVPPKPSVASAATRPPPATFTLGAIKIDEQGNMVRAGFTHSNGGRSLKLEANSKDASPLLGKAKAFWSSNEKQDSGVTKMKESTAGLKNDPNAVLETTLKASNTESLKPTHTPLVTPSERVQSPTEIKEEAKEYAKRIRAMHEGMVEEKSKISVSKNAQQPINKPVPPPSLQTELKTELSFLRPSRRTSSQYVASAITKYTPKTSAKPSITAKIPEHSTSLKTPTTDIQRTGLSMQVNPHQSSQSADDKENISASTFNPQRSMSYSQHLSENRKDLEKARSDGGRFENQVDSGSQSLDMLRTGTAKNKHIQSGGPTQIKVTGNDEHDFKHNRLRSPSPTKSNSLHQSKPPIAPKIISQSQTNNMDMTAKPQPSVSVSDNGVTHGPPAVTLFGPVKKFRPVIHRSVEKETSLHSSLMEAIQTGGGKDRLKKICTSDAGNLNKGTFAEEENERSALLAAIRAQSNSSRLRKTKSEAANELEKFRKVTAEEEISASCLTSLSPATLTGTSLAVTQPPPPPASVATPTPPPPPPPLLPQGMPCSMPHPNANSSMDPASAREAMLEAIRSGSAAERLKKVAVPKKTVQVNGRLGTIQASTSKVPQ